jgi:hypothetical protein
MFACNTSYHLSYRIVSLVEQHRCTQFKFYCVFDQVINIYKHIYTEERSIITLIMFVKNEILPYHLQIMLLCSWMLRTYWMWMHELIYVEIEIVFSEFHVVEACTIFSCFTSTWNVRIDVVFRSVVDSSVGRALSFSHEGPWFKSRWGHLFFSLLIHDLIDC